MLIARKMLYVAFLLSGSIVFANVVMNRISGPKTGLYVNNFMFSMNHESVAGCICQAWPTTCAL